MYIYIYIYICIYIYAYTHPSICIGPVDTQSHATYYLPPTRGRCVGLYRVNH